MFTLYNNGIFYLKKNKHNGSVLSILKGVVASEGLNISFINTKICIHNVTAQWGLVLRFIR